MTKVIHFREKNNIFLQQLLLFNENNNKDTHTCHKLWIEICEINQNFKGDLIKFCEIVTKIIFELPQYNQNAFILMIETCDL